MALVMVRCMRWLAASVAEAREKAAAINVENQAIRVPNVAGCCSHTQPWSTHSNSKRHGTAKMQLTPEMSDGANNERL